MKRELHLHKVYRHFKGKYYLVEDLASHSETKEPMVVYRHLYGDGSLCVRPLDMFLSEVDHDKYPNVTQKYRFQEVDDLSTDASVTYTDPDDIVPNRHEIQDILEAECYVEEGKDGKLHQTATAEEVFAAGCRYIMNKIKPTTYGQL